MRAGAIAGADKNRGENGGEERWWDAIYNCPAQMQNGKRRCPCLDGYYRKVAAEIPSWI